MDNPIFRVNGEGQERLIDTLKLVFNNSHAKSWSISSEHGFIFHWVDDVPGVSPLPVPLSSSECASMATKWLKAQFVERTVMLEPWCEDFKHDGHNTKGWLVYVNDWGHIGNSRYVICGIKPAYIWHGK